MSDFTLGVIHLLTHYRYWLRITSLIPTSSHWGPGANIIAKEYRIGTNILSIDKNDFLWKTLLEYQAILAGIDVASGQIDLQLRPPALRLALKLLQCRGRHPGTARRKACREQSKELRL